MRRWRVNRSDVPPAYHLRALGLHWEYYKGTSVSPHPWPWSQTRDGGGAAEDVFVCMYILYSYVCMWLVLRNYMEWLSSCPLMYILIEQKWADNCVIFGASVGIYIHQKFNFADIVGVVTKQKSVASRLICDVAFYLSFQQERNYQCCFAALISSWLKTPIQRRITVQKPGCLLLCFHNRIHDLWTAWRSKRRPGTTPMSSNRKVDLIVTYVDSYSVPTHQNGHWLKVAQNHLATLPVYSYDTEDSTWDARWAVMRW